MLKLEVGKKYKTRDGRTVEITGRLGILGTPYPFESAVDYYTPEGKVLVGHETERDIVAEVNAPVAARLTLEVGKTYVTADGTPVKIVSRDDDPAYPCNGSNAMCYTENGQEWQSGPTAGDLIAELQEPQAVPVGPDAAAPGPQPAEDRGFFLDELMFEIIRANPGANSNWMAHTFLDLAAARGRV